MPLTGNRNNGGSAPAIERNDTPENSPLIPIVRGLVKDGNVGDAVMVLANVTERCVTHSHAASEAAGRAEREVSRAREATEKLAMQLAQHRADSHTEVDLLKLSALNSFARVYQELDVIKAELKLQRDDIKTELRSSAKWSRIIAGAVVAAGVVAMELIK